MSLTTEQRRSTAATTPRDRVIQAASALASGALAAVITTQVLPVTGPVPFGLTWLIAFVGIYWLAVQQSDDALAARDRIMTFVITTGAAMVLLPLVFILGFVFVRGVGALSVSFFTEDLSRTGTLDAGGGLQHAIVGTLQQIAMSVVMAVPLGMMTAVFLNEVRGPLRRPVRMFVDAMSGVPSIVAGLFIYAVWLISLGNGGSGFAASLALSILMLPTVARTAEEVLRLVPGGLREASLAMGATEWRTVWSIVLPTARNGLITAVVLGIARVVGETAPLIMTSFGSTKLNANPFNGLQASLPLSVYQLLSNPFAAQQQRAYAGAFVLVVLVLTLFIITRVLGNRKSGKRTRAFRLFKKRSAS